MFDCVTDVGSNCSCVFSYEILNPSVLRWVSAIRLNWITWTCTYCLTPGHQTPLRSLFVTCRLWLVPDQLWCHECCREVEVLNWVWSSNITVKYTFLSAESSSFFLCCWRWVSVVYSDDMTGLSSTLFFEWEPTWDVWGEICLYFNMGMRWR